MAMTVGAVPATKALLGRSTLPFGLAVHPLADGPGSLGPAGIPVINFGAAGVPGLAPAEVWVTLASDAPDVLARRVFKLPVSAWTHTSLRFTAPPGYGTAVDVVIVIVGAARRDAQQRAVIAQQQQLPRVRVHTAAAHRRSHRRAPARCPSRAAEAAPRPAR
jgi:hypothetical protein